MFHYRKCFSRHLTVSWSCQVWLLHPCYILASWSKRLRKRGLLQIKYSMFNSLSAKALFSCTLCLIHIPRIACKTETLRQITFASHVNSFSFLQQFPHVTQHYLHSNLLLIQRPHALLSVPLPSARQSASISQTFYIQHRICNRTMISTTVTGRK